MSGNVMTPNQIAAMQADMLAGTPQTPIEVLEAELHLLKTSGIIEVATRNPNVFEFMRHWEGRAEKAEATIIAQASEIARLRDALKDMIAHADEVSSPLIEARAALAVKQ